MKDKKVLLLILDGWGLGQDYSGNAITQAHTPNWDRIWQDYPTAVLDASGEAVGLPEGQMGTSEVGHFTIGAGRIFFQDLVRINKAIDDSSFARKEAFVDAFEHVKKHNSTLHIMGLVSPGGVHSHQEHITALVQAAKDSEVDQVNIHAFLDGRDTAPQSADSFIQKLEDDLAEIELGQVASVCGRFYAMDRDKKWDRIDEFYKVIVGKKEAPEFSSAKKAIEASYNDGITDEFVKPRLIELGSGQSSLVQKNDAVLLINFRNDRMLELTDRLLNDQTPDNVYLASMSEYSDQFHIPVAFHKEKPVTHLGQVLADNQVKQLRVTETEKSAHMTFFFNCQQEGSLEGEDRIILDSNDVPSHDLKPEMRARDITRQITQDMENSDYQVIMANICNGDMVGHSGNVEAAKQACQIVDECLEKLEKAALANNWQVIIIADHGNVEQMLDEETGSKITAHSTNHVPFVLIGGESEDLASHEGGLSDVAPTVLEILDIDKPHEMTGESLV